jgi:soluble lytic murein transglycosylase-like protein
MTNAVALLLAVTLILHVFPRQALADVYKFTDQYGVTHYTNEPGRADYQRMVEVLQDEGPLNRAKVKPIKSNLQAYSNHVLAAAEETGVDSALVHAVITAESAYNPRAISRAGAKGLMQLMPGTAQRYKVEDVFDPAENIKGGTRYLRDLLVLFNDDLELAIAAYNAGENAVIKHRRRIPPYAETLAYVPKVMRLYKKYQALMN